MIARVRVGGMIGKELKMRRPDLTEKSHNPIY